MTRENIVKIMNDIFTTSEAAAYLNISVQRLNQLVKQKFVMPIKISKAGNLFYKDDLDERKNDVINIGKIIHKKSNEELQLNTPFMNEVITYYTLHHFYNDSDKKTIPVFNDISNKIDITKPFNKNISDISLILSISTIELEKYNDYVYKCFGKLEHNDLIIKKDMQEYPFLLKSIKDAPPYLFMRGNINLLREKIVCVVGSRKASVSGCNTAATLARILGRSNIVVASGLARGIDTAAQSTCIKYHLNTISVLGTPITRVYPKENERLQKTISEKGLVMSQFAPSTKVHPWHFPMRNSVMSGISLATIIAEAGESSGTLRQADYALKQNRLLLIPHTAVKKNEISWPQKYLQRGAHEFYNGKDIIELLSNEKIITNSPRLRSEKKSLSLF